MRNLGMFLLGAGLLVPGLGCSRTLQVTTGVCDCNPPPVQSLLVPPSTAHPSLGVYGTVAHGSVVSDPGNLPRVSSVPVGPIGPDNGSAPISPRIESVPIMPKVMPPIK